MAEINIERKSTVWPWVIGVIVLVLVSWALFELFDRDDRVTEPVTVAPMAAPVAPIAAEPLEPMDPMDEEETAPIAAMPPPPTDADNASIPVDLIIVGPAQFLGQPVVGTASVAGVPSDRGFWLEKDGQRIYAVIAKSPNMEDAVNVNPGQQVRIAGVVYDKTLAQQIAGGLEPDTMQIVADQPAFLLVDAQNVQVVDR